MTKRRLIIGLITVPVLFALAALGWLLLVFPRTSNPGNGDIVTVRVPEGSNARQAALAFAAAGCLENPEAFAIYLRVQGVDRRLRTGPIPVRNTIRPENLAHQLDTRRLGPPTRVTIPEGFTRFDIAERLEELGVCSRSAFLFASASAPDGVDAPSAEGFLFPDTYEFRIDSDARDVLRTMTETHRRRIDDLLDTRREEQAGLGLSETEIVTLASIVEREAAVPDERSTIAGVFLNRLRSETFRPRHRLQADPTVSYGCLAEPQLADSCDGFDGRITRAMLQDSDNRYNSYRHAGLPPGPVCNPGIAAIDAVLRHEEHEYLYFVARGGRRHAFSEELGDHNDAVSNYREIERSREQD